LLFFVFLEIENDFTVRLEAEMSTAADAKIGEKKSLLLASFGKEDEPEALDLSNPYKNPGNLKTILIKKKRNFVVFIS
jgi:hypothetical protein